MDQGDESGGEVCLAEPTRVKLARQLGAELWCRQAVLDNEASADEKFEGDEVDEGNRLEQTEPVPLSADGTAAEAGPQEGDADGEQQDELKAGKGKGKGQGKGKGKKGKAGPDPEALASAAEQRLRTATLLFQERFQREQVPTMCLQAPDTAASFGTAGG